jgi:1,4-dihydroxy-2-naphthoate octaprenyltransferase
MPSLRLLHPLHLLFAALTYAFGASLADYLGKPFRTESFWFGLIIVFLLQAAMSSLSAIYRPLTEPLVEGETRSDRQSLRNNLLYVSVASLGSVAVLAYTLFNLSLLSLSAFLFLVFSILLLLAYSLPPLRLLSRGFGEILLAVQLAYMIPSFSFTLQAGSTHPILFLAIPVTFLAFAFFVVQDFQSFARDQTYNRVTVLTLLGWERVVPLHHIFLLFAYIFLLAMPAFNLSLRLLAPAFLTLPFALFQIYQLRSIALGAKPNWTLLHATALSVFGLTIYFLTLTFWLR